MELKDCILLAGGKGTRLQTVVSDKPKCLADIQGNPFLAYILRQISQYQIRQLVLSVGYLKEMVMQFMEQLQPALPFPVCYATEDEPLGTGGAVMHAMSYCQTDDVLVLNGDTMFDVNLDVLVAFQKQKQSDCTLALKPMAAADRYGLVDLNADHQITAFHEKKAGSSGLINGGVYCLYRSAFISLPFEQVFSFEKDYLETYLHERQFNGLVQDHYFIDIGIPDDYTKACIELPQRFPLYTH